MNVQNDRKGSPLMFAAEFGHVECVRALLNAGADIDAQDDDGTDACVVPCICAVQKKYLTFFKFKFNKLLLRDSKSLETHTYRALFVSGPKAFRYVFLF